MYPEETGYKYLGIFKQDSISNVKMKGVRGTYMQRLEFLLITKVNSKNLMAAINSWAVDVVSYNEAILNCGKAKMDEMCKETRESIIKFGALHPKVNVIRLYPPRKVGGK